MQIETENAGGPEVIDSSSLTGEQRYEEVGGWLALLLFKMMVVAPIGTAFIYLVLGIASRDGGLPPILLYLFLTDLFLAVLSVVAGYRLWRVRRGALRLAKVSFWLMLAFQVPIGVRAGQIVLYAIIPNFCALVYLYTSRRVRGTYCR